MSTTAAQSLTPELLAEAGRRLLGEEWQRPLARALGPMHPRGPRTEIDPRLVRRWAAGERPIPSWVTPALAALLEQEGKAIARVTAKLKAMSAAA